MVLFFCWVWLKLTLTENPKPTTVQHDASENPKFVHMANLGPLYFGTAAFIGPQWRQLNNSTLTWLFTSQSSNHLSFTLFWTYAYEKDKLIIARASNMAGSGVFKEIIDEDGVYRFYFNGEWGKSSSGKSVAIINPTTRQTQFRIQGVSFFTSQFWVVVDDEDDCKFSVFQQLVRRKRWRRLLKHQRQCRSHGQRPHFGKEQNCFTKQLQYWKSTKYRLQSALLKRLPNPLRMQWMK